MMLTITDICSTDPSDPSHCAGPADIKVDGAKAKIMHGLSSDPQGDEYPQKVWWFFMKCWADVSSFRPLFPANAGCQNTLNLTDHDIQGLAQPAYQTPGNWFTNPPLANTS